jgi:tetratricopeptide (TPR) repeat protein
VLRRINPADVDYGAWLEHRRAALLRTSVQNPYFWYSVTATLLLIITTLAYAKRRSDFHKYAWMSSGWLADFYNETQLARGEMDRAIEKHNRHIEKCNRAIEAEADGSWTRQTVNEEAALWRQKYDEAARALEEAVANDRKLEVALREKEVMVADMSVRIQNVERKIGDTLHGPGGAPLTINESNKHLIGRINTLERQLREEQARNKSLKGRA